MAELQELADWLTRWLQDEESLRLTVLAGVALIVFVLSLIAAQRLRAWADPVKRRLEAQAAEYEAVVGAVSQARDPNTLRLLERLGRGLVPLDARKRSRIATKLAQAGYRSNRAAALFYAAKIIGLVVLPVIVGGTLLFLGMEPDVLLLLTALSLLIGVLLPDSWLAKRVRKRQGVLRNALPDALDLMVVCVEAGLGLNAAIQRVASEMKRQHPELSNEFNITIVQIRAGLDTKVALEDMVPRTGLDEIKGLVSTLVQALRFGTGIATTLRVFSDEMRDKRLKAAEEQAAKVANKMLLPIGLFMIPAFLIIALGPPLIELGKRFSGGL
ncbi:MAG: type II secretion system F family protein [Gammaproteobacteria bacterium]|jgi:tight adherence protein C|nr:type II secretion system F family protein [Gammaproteobacteria bacterium]